MTMFRVGFQPFDDNVSGLLNREPVWKTHPPAGYGGAGQHIGDSDDVPRAQAPIEIVVLIGACSTANPFGRHTRPLDTAGPVNTSATPMMYPEHKPLSK